MQGWGGYANYSDSEWIARANQAQGGTAMTATLWKCDQMRAGRLYSRSMFDTREEAERFARKMQQMEPDQMMRIEAIEARQVWN